MKGPAKGPPYCEPRWPLKRPQRVLNGPVSSCPSLQSHTPDERSLLALADCVDRRQYPQALSVGTREIRARPGSITTKAEVRPPLSLATTSTTVWARVARADAGKRISTTPAV